jgi:hypothetical protein
MTEHLSVFMENKPGKLDSITKVLADAKVNLLGISVSSLGEFGVSKLLVDQPDEAYKALKEHHFTVCRRRVAVVIIDDEPGSLHKVLTLLATNKINVDDCYGFVIETSKEAAIVLEIEEYPEAVEVLRKHNLRILD